MARRRRRGSASSRTSSSILRLCAMLCAIAFCVVASMVFLPGDFFVVVSRKGGGDKSDDDKGVADDAFLRVGNAASSSVSSAALIRNDDDDDDDDDDEEELVKDEYDDVERRKSAARKKKRQTRQKNDDNDNNSSSSNNNNVEMGSEREANIVAEENDSDSGSGTNDDASTSEKMSPRQIAFLSMPKTISSSSRKESAKRNREPQTLSIMRVKFSEELRRVKNEQKMRREITRSIKQHATVAKRTAKFVEKSSSGSSNRNRNRNRVGESSRGEDENNDGEEQRNQDPQKMSKIDRLAWEINTKEFNKSKFPWAEPFILLCERYSRFLRNGVRYKTVPWGNLMEDINVKFEADGQTITSNTEMVMVTFAIERLREIYDEESRLRTNLEQIERKLLASVQESSNRALEKFKADSGVVDLDDVDGAKDPELSSTRGGRSNGRNNKQQYFEEEREFNEAFIPKVRKLAKALLKDVQWVHDEDSEEYKNMYATYDNFHKSHASGERIDENDIQVPTGVSLGEFEKRFLPENGQPYPIGKRKPSCALVGNSRALLANDRLGELIDDHDIVMRLNQAPSKRFEKYVGHKTTHRLLNAKWTQAYKSNPYLQTEPNVTFVITRTDWLTYLKAAKVMANLKPNYFPKSSSSSLSEEEVYNTNSDAERDTTSGEFGEIVTVDLKMPSEEQDVDIAERIEQGMPTLRLLSRSAVDGAGDVLRALKQKLEIIRGKAYKGKASPSSGFLGFHLLRQICESLDVYGIGDDIAFSGAAWHYFETQHFQASREFGAVPHHSFTLESDVMQLLDATEQIRHQRIHVDKDTMQRLEFMKSAPSREIRAPQNLERIANAQAKRDRNKRKSAPSEERSSSSFGGSGGMSHAESSMMKRGYGESEKERSGGSKANKKVTADPLSGLV